MTRVLEHMEAWHLSLNSDRGLFIRKQAGLLISPVCGYSAKRVVVKKALRLLLRVWRVK